jgi:hypothetical protein
MKDQLSECLPQLMQLEEGLSVCGVLKSIQDFPRVWREVFEKDHSIQFSAKSLLHSTDVDFSLSQLQKEREIDTYKAFTDVINLIEEQGELYW